MPYRIIVLIFFLIGTVTPFACLGQYNILGKPGLVLTPKPAREQNASQLLLGYTYLPNTYALNNFVRTNDDEDYYFANLDFLKRVKVNFVLTRLRNTRRIGIGDRHVDIQVALLYEKKWIPNISVIVSPSIIGSNSLTHNVLLLSKTIELNNDFKAEFSGGYGLPYIYIKPPTKLNLPTGYYQWVDKSRIGNNYLSGVFGGFILGYKDKFWFAGEHDGNKINVSASTLIKNSLFLRAAMLGLDTFSYTVGYQIPLSTTPKWVKKYESNF